MYTDDTFLAAVGTKRLVALLRSWHKITRAVGLTMAIPKKGRAGSSVLWLGIVFIAGAGVNFLPRDKAVRAVANMQRMLAHAADTAALRKLCCLLQHVRGVWTGSPAWMHGLCHKLRGDPNPAALVAPSPQFVDASHTTDESALFHKQFDGCVAALQTLGDSSGTVRKYEAAWHRY
eukprot:2140194-Pleurochrysis_carterae.AAC.1